MKKNHSLAARISDVSWSDFFRQLSYKSDWYGNNLIKIGRFEPSSKLCSCGYLNKNLKISQSEWECPSCHNNNDRDLLAAINIKNFGLMGLKYTARGTGVEPTEMSRKRIDEVGISKRKIPCLLG